MDRRATWDNSPGLRDDMIADLRNWAAASNGGWPRLTYPGQVPFAVEPSKAPPPFDARRAEKTEAAMLLASAQDGAPKAIGALMLHFMSSRAAHTKAKILGVSRRKFYHLIDDGLYRVWAAGLDIQRAHLHTRNRQCPEMPA